MLFPFLFYSFSVLFSCLFYFLFNSVPFSVSQSLSLASHNLCLTKLSTPFLQNKSLYLINLRLPLNESTLVLTQEEITAYSVCEYGALYWQAAALIKVKKEKRKVKVFDKAENWFYASQLLMAIAEGAQNRGWSRGEEEASRHQNVRIMCLFNGFRCIHFRLAKPFSCPPACPPLCLHSGSKKLCNAHSRKIASHANCQRARCV